MKNTFIRKSLALLLALSMLFALSACGVTKKLVSSTADTIQSLVESNAADETADEATPEAGNEEEDPEPEEEPAAEEPSEGKIYEENGRYSDEEIEVEYIKFSEMEYSRPDLDAFTESANHVVEVLDSGASYEEICEAMDAYETECGHFNTMYTLAEIHSYLDMTDEFYAEEYAWVEENGALFAKVEDHMFYRAAANEYADRLEEDYFWEGFTEEYDDESESIYTDAYMELDRQEKELLTEYRDLIAEPTILFRGKERNFDELLDELLFEEDYNGYYQALYKYYNKYNELLSDIYIRLIKVRGALAEERGFESYELMQYEDCFERDYTPEEAEVLIEAVREYIIPVYEKINNRYENSEDYFEVSEDFLLTVMDNFTGNMDGDIREAFKFMREYELYDVGVSSKKVDMSFETYISDYESPFVFANSYGDSSDIMTFAHEFGHFCRDYVNYGMSSGIDVQEIFSQAMEYLSMFYLDSDTVTSDELYSLLLTKVLDIYGSYIQAGYTEFEHRVYAMDPDELTADKINDIWIEICDDYGMTVAGLEDLYTMVWIDIGHFFEYPFYCISYTVSNEVALQIFEMEAAEEGTGLEMYGNMLLSDCDKILDLVGECGLESPFSEDRIKESADFLLGIAKNVL